MKIRFTKQVQLEIITDFNYKTEESISHAEMFNIGDTTEINILTDYPELGTMYVQFGDGSICVDFPKDCYEVIKGYSPFDDPPEYHESFA